MRNRLSILLIVAACLIALAGCTPGGGLGAGMGGGAQGDEGAPDETDIVVAGTGVGNPTEEEGDVVRPVDEGCRFAKHCFCFRTSLPADVVADGEGAQLIADEGTATIAFEAPVQPMISLDELLEWAGAGFEPIPESPAIAVRHEDAGVVTSYALRPKLKEEEPTMIAEIAGPAAVADHIVVSVCEEYDIRNIPTDVQLHRDDTDMPPAMQRIPQTRDFQPVLPEGTDGE